MKKVLIYGDSLVDGIKLDQFEYSLECNPGFTTRDFLVQEEKDIGLTSLLDEDNYDYLVLIMGTNDDLYSQQQIEESHANICNLVKYLDVSTKLIVCTIMNEKWNNCLRDLNLEFTICDFLNEEIDTTFLENDGVHLNKKGKELFSQSLYTRINFVKN